MSLGALIGTPGTDRGRQQGALRWALVRLVLLWAPIASALALALWTALWMTLEPWGYRDDGPPAVDAVPSQLLFAVVLLVAGRRELAPQGGSSRSNGSVWRSWALLAVLLAIGGAALHELALRQPVLQ